MSSDNLREKLETRLGTNADNQGFANGDQQIGLVLYKSKLYSERFGLPKGIEISADSGFVLPDSIIDKAIEKPAQQLYEYDSDSRLKALYAEEEKKCDGFEAIVDGRRFLIGRDNYFQFEGDFYLMTETKVISILSLDSWPSDWQSAMAGEDNQLNLNPKTFKALHSINDGHSIIDIIPFVNRFIEGPKTMVNSAKIELTEFFGVHDLDDLLPIFNAIGLRVIDIPSRYINSTDSTRDNMTEVDALIEAIRVLIPKFNESLER